MNADPVCPSIPADGGSGSSDVQRLERRLAVAVEASARLEEEVAQLRLRLGTFEVEVARRLAMLDDDRAALARSVEASLEAS